MSMHPRVAPIAAAVVAAVCLWGAAPAGHAEQAPARDATVEALRQEVAALKAENQALREQVKLLQAQSNNPGTTPNPTPANTTAQAASDPAPRVADLEQDLAEARAKVELLETEKAELEKLAGVTAKGELVESAKARIAATYDAQADRTVVEAKAVAADGPQILGFSGYAVGAGFDFAGRELEAMPEQYHLLLYTSGNKDKRVRTAKEVTLIVDGQQMTAPVTDYEVLGSFGGSRPGSKGRSAESRDERLTITIDAATAARLGAASSLELHLPKFPLELRRDHIALIEGVRRRAKLLVDGPQAP